MPPSEIAVTEPAPEAVNGRTPRELAVLIVTGRRTDLLDRTLASVDKWLPEVRIHVWDNRSPASPEVADLAADRPDVVWTFCESNLGYIVAMNRLMAQVPACDALQLDAEAELLGPLARAREILAEPGVAVVSPTVVGPDDAPGRPWDVAHRRPTVLRSLVESAGYADALRTYGLSDLYPAAPDEVDGYLARGSLLVSRDAWDALGPFDERFFGHGEDAAWQRAARKTGWSLRVVDEVEPQVRHTGTPSASDDPDMRRQEELRRATRIMVLGNRRNRGTGRGVRRGATWCWSGPSAGAARPAARSARSRGAQAGGRPESPRHHQRTSTWRRGAPARGARQRAGRARPPRHDGRAAEAGALHGRARPAGPPADAAVLAAARGHGDRRVAIVVGGVTNTEIGIRRWAGAPSDGPPASVAAGCPPRTTPPSSTGPPTAEAQARALRTADGLLVLARATPHGSDPPPAAHRRRHGRARTASPWPRPRPYRPGDDGRPGSLRHADAHRRVQEPAAAHRRPGRPRTAGRLDARHLRRGPRPRAPPGSARPRT